MLRRGLTVAAFLAHQRAGGLAEGPRAELIGGVVRAPARLGPREAAVVAYLERALGQALARLDEGAALRVEPGAPFRLGPNDLLRADLALLRPSAGTGGPGRSLEPRGAVLVVEVARGRLSHEVRAPLYAAAGAAELWLLDVARGWAEVLRSPWGGLYRSRTLWYPGEPVPLTRLGLEVEAMPKT